MKKILSIFLFLGAAAIANGQAGTKKGIKVQGTGSGGSGVSMATITDTLNNRFTRGSSIGVLGLGQSNMVCRDITQGTWTYTVDQRILTFKNGSWQVADPSLNNICYSDPATTAIRNNIAWQFAKNYLIDHPYDTVKILCRAVGSQGSWLWTPKTTGNGEVTSSNARLTDLITYLDSIPADFNAKIILWHQGEQDAADGNMAYWLDNMKEIYDTLINHSKVNDSAMMLPCYPASNLTTFKPLTTAIDSIYYGLKDMGNRNIIAVRFLYPGFDNVHFTNESIDLIGRRTYSEFKQGYANGTLRQDTSIFKPGASYSYTTGKIVIGSATQSLTAAILNVEQGGTSSLAQFKRSDAGTDGSQQTLRFAPANDALNGFLQIHSSETGGVVTDKNSIEWGDTSVSIKNLASVRVIRLGNNMTSFNQPVTFSSNILASIANITTSLTIKSAASNGFQLILGTSGTTTGDSVTLKCSAGSGVAPMGGLQAIRAASGGGTSLMYSTNFTNLVRGLSLTNNGSVVIGTNATPDASAKLDIQTTTQGFLGPRMTTAQKLAIASPAEGLDVYDLTLHQKSYYNGTSWINY